MNDWVNNREAGDLRCYRAHYDVIVMSHTWMIQPDIYKYSSLGIVYRGIFGMDPYSVLDA